MILACLIASGSKKISCLACLRQARSGRGVCPRQLCLRAGEVVSQAGRASDGLRVPDVPLSGHGLRRVRGMARGRDVSGAGLRVARGDGVQLDRHLEVRDDSRDLRQRGGYADPG